MKSKKNLVLIGMMSSGKSTIGELLAKKLNFKFFDIDKIIENETKMKITEIFKIKGENFFRNLEEKTTVKLLNFSNAVISLGGGGFVNEIIRKETNTKSKTFWLDWNLDTLISRIRKRNNRPVALALNNNELKNLIIKRSKYYSKAKYKINCQKLTRPEIIKKILNLYESS
jgi:shikimate kinase|tara:strand:- start:265 stop:777 length:513 start_codon:yes stop_codon:yes gene_type:complete